MSKKLPNGFSLKRVKSEEELDEEEIAKLEEAYENELEKELDGEAIDLRELNDIYDY